MIIYFMHKVFPLTLLSLCLMILPALAKDKFLEIKDIKTPAGISVWFIEDHTLPIIAMQFMFKDSGAALDPTDRQGLARMLSNTMDEGAGDLDSQAFQQALSDQSINLSFSSDRDGFGGSLKTLTHNRAKAFDLLTLALTKPRFDAEAVGRMRDGNLMRIRSSMTEPDWMAARLLNSAAFEGHPYAQNSGGTLSSLAAIDSKALRAFHDRNLTRDRLVIAVTGDIKQADLIKAVDQVFGSLPAKAIDAKTIPETAVKNAGQIVLFEQDIPQTYIEILLPAFGRNDPDYYALQVLNYIFGGGGFGSRLMDEVREKRGLTYGIYSGLGDYFHTDTVSISTSTKNESVGDVLKITRAEMEKLRTTPVTDKELSDAKSYITGSMPLSLSSSGAIAGIMLGLQEKGLPVDYLDHYADNIRKVTAADLQRVANRVLKPETMLTVLVGKPENVKATRIVKELPDVE